MNFYKNKYIKYKHKYLELIGGNNSLDTETNSALLSLNNKNHELYLKIQKIKTEKYIPPIKTEKYIPPQVREKLQLEAKQIEEHMKYMGLTGWDLKDVKKLQLPSRDININNKTMGKYIWDVDSQIMEHLKTFSEVTGSIITYYANIPSLKFVPIKDLPEGVINQVQKLIKLSYPTKKNEDEYPKEYPYNRLNLLQKNLSKGYYYEYSKEIVDNNSIASQELFKKIQQKKPHDTFKKLNALILNSERTCSNAHNVQGNTIKTKPYEPVLFEDLFIGKDSEDLDFTFKDNKQLLYTSTPHISKYFNNSKIIVSPFLQPNLTMGLLSYNTKTNKAITQCIFKHSPLVFPLRIVLYLSLSAITYINLYENIKHYNYIGFFLIRLSNETENIITSEKCRIHYENYDTQFPESKEPYWVIFVFQNKKLVTNKHAEYEFINYRCNRVDRGTIMEQKKVIYTEIEQLICMYANNDLEFYILLLINNNSIKKSTTDSCQTFFEQFKGYKKEKISPEICLISNFHHTFIKLLNKYFILPYTVYNNEQHITEENYKYNEQQILICKKQSIEELLNNIKLFKGIQMRLLFQYILYLLNDYTLSLENIEYILLYEKDIKNYSNILKYYNTYIELLNIEIQLITHNDIKYIEIKSKELTYGLFPCYFDWSSNNELYDDIEDDMEIERRSLLKIINSVNKDAVKLLLNKLYVKEQLFIKYGKMKEEKKKVFKRTTCIEKECVQFLNDSYRDKYMLNLFSDNTIKTENMENLLNIDEYLG